MPPARPVVVEYADVLAAPGAGVDLSAALEEAFGFEGHGIIAVANVPGLADARHECLPMAHRFASLPEETKAQCVHAPSSFSFGWSHGKERMSEGQPDFAKGSFYFNPTHDAPFSDPATIAKYCSFAHPNIWPEEEELPGFRSALRGLGGLIVDVGALLARHIDVYVASQLPTYPPGALEAIVRTSRVAKARLLYYFPLPASPAPPAPSSSSSPADGTATPSPPPGEGNAWCGWHNDHGSLTGLAPAMFLDGEGREVPCPDETAGLWVKGRTGLPVRVAVPSTCLAFQIGETAQIHTGGVLQATPHAVKGPSIPCIARSTLAVFMEPEWPARMASPEGADAEKVLRGSAGELLPPGVPPLVKRWKVDGSQDFGEFTQATLSAYYG